MFAAYRNQDENLPFHDDLETLYYTNDQATSLPPLPAKLKTLNCTYNYKLTTLSPLPPVLENLACYNNKLTSLPSLPDTLTHVWCSQNYLTSIPPLPAGLEALTCYGNQLDSLPVLPEGLVRLSCAFNQLTSLPPLPAGLTNLSSYRNQLTSLPPLPKSLLTLNCADNQLTSLPPLPKSLLTLNCADNQLTSLPPLPEGLQVLTCENNPYVEPFKTWVDEYRAIPYRDILCTLVNTYWRNRASARDLKSLMVTVGQRETQAQMGNPRDESEDRVQDCLNADCLSVIAEFLTGIKGSVVQQQKRLKCMEKDPLSYPSSYPRPAV